MRDEDIKNVRDFDLSDAWANRLPPSEREDLLAHLRDRAYAWQMLQEGKLSNDEYNKGNSLFSEHANQLLAEHPMTKEELDNRNASWDNEANQESNTPPAERAQHEAKYANELQDLKQMGIDNEGKLNQPSNDFNAVKEYFGGDGPTPIYDNWKKNALRNPPQLIRGK